MNSHEVIEPFEIEIDEQSRVTSEFMGRVVNEIRRALAAEKGKRRLTQQEIAEKIGTTRAVINRQVQGLENLGAKRIAEILWAIGWEPYFEARPIPRGINESLSPQIQKIDASEKSSAQLPKPKERRDLASALSEARKGFQQDDALSEQQTHSLAQDNAYSDQRRAANG
jgi:hypothetical protein